MYYAMSKSKHLIRVIGVLFGIACIGFLAYSLGYVPCMYNYLIWRVESANTASEEKQAFRIATDWGRVWEVYLNQSEGNTKKEQRSKEPLIVSLEWLESSPYSGAAYSAHRSVIDTNNLLILYSKNYANKLKVR